jgi:hypothetical protein
MPLKERLAFAHFYDGVTNQQNVIQIERNLVVRLTLYLDQPSLTPDQRLRFLEDLAEDRSWTAVGRNNNLGLLRSAKPMGLVAKPMPPALTAQLALPCRTTPAPAG